MFQLLDMFFLFQSIERYYVIEGLESRELKQVNFKRWIERCNAIESFSILLQPAPALTFSDKTFRQPRYLLSASSQEHSSNYIRAGDKMVIKQVFTISLL